VSERTLPAGLHPETLAVRSAVDKSQYGENSEALYLSSSFTQPDCETAARRFAGEEEGYIYSRFTNPTVASMEKRLAALEGMEDAIATSSGMSAILLLCMGLLKAGDHVVCSQSVFGSTIKLIGTEFGKFGVQSSFVSQTDVGQWKAAIRPNTRLLFAETPTNPLTDVCDIRALADLAHEAGALLAVDNCFFARAQQPVKFGADIVVHSASGTWLAGLVVAGARQWRAPDRQVRSCMRSAGMSLSPFNAWVVLKGMETLAIRMQAQSQRALELARWLEAHPKVERVYYPGLQSHAQHELAMAQQSGCGGAVVSLTSGRGRRAGSKERFSCVDYQAVCRNWAREDHHYPSRTSHLAGEQRRGRGA
jgi:O-succinylhomoserine sulfhydrylase